MKKTDRPLALFAESAKIWALAVTDLLGRGHAKVDIEQ